MRERAGRFFASLGLVSVVAVAGCATYHPQPLPTAADLARTPAVRVPVSELHVPGLAPHAIPPGGLDATTVMTLAVLNNPDLKAARLQAGVASAQVLEAGLLPNPQFSGNFAESVDNYGGALGLSQDIESILTRGAAKAAARAAAKQVNLNILWQEVQVAERARELFLQARAEARLQRVLEANQKLLQENYRRDQTAMERGDVTAATTAADLTLVANADTAARQLQTESNLTQHELDALLGLQPDAQLHLIGRPRIAAMPKAEFEAAVAALPHRRADLLALQAGYQSQEEMLRRAVLAQFPALSAGVNLERDPVEGVNSFGPTVTLTLPIFNHNQGQIAIERASRAVLRQQYQAQLDSAVSQADEVWKASRILAAQLRDLNGQIPVLRRTAAAAQQSLIQDNLDAALYVTTESSVLTREMEAIQLQASLENARSALATLLGLPFGSQ